MIIRPKKIDAIRALVGGGVSGPTDGSNTVFHRGQTPPTEKEIEDKLKELQAEYDALDYSRKRKVEYPEWNFQLDYIFHNGLAKWKTDIVQPVKDKFPKP